MQVKLNAFRDGRRPGDIVEIPDAEAADVIAHGAAFPADDTDAEPDKKARAGKGRGRRTVRAEAALQASSQTQDGETPSSESAAP